MESKVTELWKFARPLNASKSCLFIAEHDKFCGFNEFNLKYVQFLNESNDDIVLQK